MAEPPRDVPAARAAPPSRHLAWAIWLVPIVAVLIGVWLAVKTVLDKGPTVTISFLGAEGIEPGKTKIKYKDVDIGVVRAVALSAEKDRVVVTAELSRDVEDFLVEDTRFWVVRARIAGGGVSGLGTVLSGAHIGVDRGRSTQGRRDFVGLEVPPVLTAGLPGKAFVLKAEDLSSIGHGTPIYFRRIQVGEITAYELDQDGRGVTVRIFVHAPYDQFVTTETRFWQASGIDVELSAAGVQLRTESVSALLLGGLAFGTPPDAPAADSAPADHVFRLHSRRVEAFQRQEFRVEPFVLVFRESVRGLQVGAPVEFRGITIGEVAKIGIDFNSEARSIDIPVEIRVFPDRFRARVRSGQTPERSGTDEWRRTWDNFTAAGLRAQMRTGNLLTGQLYVALDFFPKAPKASINWRSTPPELPTTPGGLQELQTTLTSIAAKLDRIPYEQIAGDLRQTLQSLDATLKGAEKLVARFDNEVAPELKATLDEAKRTFAQAERTLAADSPVLQDLREALRESNRAAQSLRVLLDYLERHPEALIRGKREGVP